MAQDSVLRFVVLHTYWLDWFILTRLDSGELYLCKSVHLDEYFLRRGGFRLKE